MTNDGQSAKSPRMAEQLFVGRPSAVNSCREERCRLMRRGPKDGTLSKAETSDC
jgi:hypothetical protein